MASKVNDLELYRKRKKRKKSAKRLIVFLCVFVVSISAYYTKDKWIPIFDDIFDKYQTTINLDGKLAGGNFPIEFAHASKVRLYELDGRVALLTDTHLNVFKKNGEREYSEQFGYSNSMASTAKNRAVVYESGGYSFTVLNKLKKVYSKKLDEQILNASISDKDNVAIVTKTNKYASFLTIYDKKGQPFFYWSNGQRIIDVNFIGNSNQCLVTTMFAKDGEVNAKVIKLDFSGDGKEVFQSENLKTMGITTCIMANDSIFLVGIDKLYHLNSDGETVNSYTYPARTMIDFAHSDDYVAVAFESYQSEKSDLYIYSNKDEPNVVSIDSSIKSVKTKGSYIYILTDTLLSSYNINGKLIATAEVDGGYQDFDIIGDYAYLSSVKRVDRIDYKT